MIKYTNKIDMVTGGIPVVIHVNQYDSDFSLVFELYSSDGEFTLESGTTVAIRGTKTDGNGYSVDATIDIPNKKVTVTGDQQMTACAGRNTFELTLSKNNKELNTANFILDVERSALDKDTISDSVIRELVNVIDRTDEIIAAAGQADAAVEEAASLVAQTNANAERAEEAADDAEDDLVEARQHVQEILSSNAATDEMSAEALSKATNAENHMASLDSQMQALVAAMQDVSIDPDDLGLEQDEDTFYVYPTYKGVRSENGIPLASGGGGGGGGEAIGAVLTVTNTSGWLSKTIASGANCVVTFAWSSIEDEMATGDGNIRITVNDVVRSTYQIQQGNVSVNLAPYLATGTNKVKARISDVYDQGKTITFNITSIALSISSSFDASTPYSGAISFPYIPVGAVEKTVYFILDGQQIGTQVTSVSGRQMSYTIPQQSHGGHKLRVYFEATINNETVRSNELYCEYISLEPLNNTVIITSSFNATTQPQYASIAIPYQVYDPANLTADVTISANGTVVSTQTVDRSMQSYTYRANNYGSLVIAIASGNTTKTINITVTESDIDVDPVTQDLKLFLSSGGRSNNEEHPDTWTFGTGSGQIACTFSGFNFTSDGWQSDEDGITVLRVSGAARLTIPYKPFASDFRSTGKTIELEFATRNVLDYDAVILSCLNGGRGLSMTAQKATLTSEQSEISIQYKEDEHIRVAFVAEKRSKNRFLTVYIDGIPSGIVQYPDDDDFSQVSPVNISVGSNDCTIDLYCIRVYDNDLTGNQILDNWIADTQIGTLMLERYTRNAVYDAYGKIVIANLPPSLPYFILNAPELPQYKGDKKTISGSYVDPIHPSKSFTFTGCQINVQGTSSAVYARKNYDLQFKNGFEMTGGSHADNYALRTGAIPFNRFVLKADVASSEGANNVELVRLYNDACPYKTPEMVADSKVRWGIDGFPIVVFWNNTDTQETRFWGKFNFNLPKRAPAPYGYDNAGNMESWEFQNNTSNLMLFKSDYFDEAMYTDPDTGETKELWRYDYEARFPSDAWTNYSILQEFQSFVYSTYRANATGNNLAESVTYGDTTYTQDTAEYRLAKFKAEFPSYAELNSFLFYYIFTELFLMVDSRAKNLFIGFNGSQITASGRTATRKATAQPYDMDTAIGINNEGTLTFGYALEDTDHLQGGANIFNGQDSVLWCNIRDAFDTEIRQLYQTLRSGGILSYATIEQRFEDHQIIWPEAVWIEDSKFKYTDPLTNPDPGKEPTADYLSMLQGSKAQQRKWWLTNRFKYMDSKWNAGDALSQVIVLRGYAKANITITPYADIYPTVKYASYVVQARGTHGQPTTLVCPLDTVSDTEISIYSAPQLASVGDLSGLKVGFANFSAATRLQSIKIGDSSNSYSNTNLYSLTLGNNTLLKSIDVRNCSGLGDTSQVGHTQTVVDISNCVIVENVYFDGTKVQGVTLPNGGNIKVLHLPNTITNLTILNQKTITDLTVAGYSNISTLRIENCPTVDTKTILNSVPANTRVRLIGFYWTATDANAIDVILDLLDTMRGLDESGNNMETAQVSGEIHTGTLTGSQIAAFRARYPYINYTADHTSAVLSYYNGSTLITTETVLDGGNGSYTGTTPTKTADAQYTYTFAGWSKTDDNTVDSDALTAVTADRSVYACFTATLRKYTVTFVRDSGDGGGTLQTISNVDYGTTITAASSYTGSTPTTTHGDATDYPFEGWSPASATVTGNTTFTAKFGSPVEVTEIEDDWATIVSKIANGTATYKVGNYKPLDLGTEGVVNMQIVGKNTSPLASGSGTATYDWLSMELLATSHRMNPSNNNNAEGTGSIGGWEKCEMRTYLKETIKPLIPETVRNAIKEVTKYSRIFDTSGTAVNDVPSTEDLWLPSRREMFGAISNAETMGPIYDGVFPDNASRIKKKVGASSAEFWWCRSAHNGISFYGVHSSGNFSYSGAYTSYALPVGFSI